jgi:phosphoenolpyruvate-protein kinase (PTS system EI component)
LVTFDGSPAAHLFQAARSLGVPAVAAVDLDPAVLASGDWGVAVDGNQGTVSIMEW